MISSKKTALIIGSGSHARVILSILEHNGDYENKFIYSKNILYEGEKIFNVPVIDSFKIVEDLKETADVFIAFGNNDEREDWYNRLVKFNYSMPNLIAHSAFIDANASMGNANVICHNAFLGPEVLIQNNNLINTSSILEHGVKVGSSNHFAPGSIVLGNSNIGNNNFIGSQSVVKEKLIIGDKITIGAGAVVVKNLSDYGGIYIGNPAKFIKRGKI